MSSSINRPINDNPPHAPSGDQTSGDKPSGDTVVWLWIAIVFVGVVAVLYGIYTHEKAKPDSPHALVAAAFNQMMTTKEWQPGMGPKPLIYHPAGFQRTPLPWQTPQPGVPQPNGGDGLVWHPLPPP